MLDREAFKGANLIKMSLVTTAAMLAIWLLALVERPDAAEAEDSLPHNGKIAFSADDGNIYTVEPNGSNLRELTGGANPNWSPDGTKIAFESQDSIWVMGADGSNLRRLTPNGSDVSYSGPNWSPDGTKLAFTGLIETKRAYQKDIYTMDVDGSNITNITRNSKDFQTGITFSPDGSQICLPGFSGESEIFVMNVDGSNPTRLTTEERGHAMGCSWSPDATKIAYSVVPYGLGGGPNLTEAEVYIMNADGSGRTKLTNTPESGWPGAGSWSPEWSPDGAKITFTSDRNGDAAIYTMDADGSDVTQITNLPGPVAYADWQPLPGTTVDQPDTGGPSLLWMASALLFFSGGSLLYAVAGRGM